jgi:hypothetical protein
MLAVACLASAAAGCAHPRGEVMSIAVRTAPARVGEPEPRPPGGPPYLKIDLRLSSNEVFQDRFWILNTFTKDRFCDERYPGSVVINGPVFGAEANTNRPRIWAMSDEEQPSVFIPLHHPTRLRYLVPVEGLGERYDVLEYDAVAEPRDICFELVSARGLLSFLRQPRTRTIVLSGADVARALSSAVNRNGFNPPRT